MRVFRLFSGLLLMVAAVALLFWVFGPGWLAPAPDFQQGPGAAVAYVSLTSQFRNQTMALLTGKPVRFTLTEQEFSGIAASALLSGYHGPKPEPKVRARLLQDVVRIEAVIWPREPWLPARFRGPVGLGLNLVPETVPGGAVVFHITEGTVGRIPLSPVAICWSTELLDLTVPGFDPDDLTLTVPVERLIGEQLGRVITIQEMKVTPGKVALTAVAHIPRQGVQAAPRSLIAWCTSITPARTKP